MRKYLISIFFIYFITAFVCPDNSLQAKRRFPIMASHALKGEFGTIENYRIIEDAGFTLAFEYFASRDEVIRHLNAASKTKVKLIVYCPELERDLENTIRVFDQYSSFGGYYLSDEPGFSSFDEISKKIKRIKQLDDQHHLWVNLYPNYASSKQIETKSYEDYIDKYLETVNPPVLSFDHYGLTKKGIRSDYYNNLEIVSKRCKESGTPFWAYVLASEFGDYIAPTKGSLAFQAYTNLAYGAKGIEYFSYRRIIGAGLNMTVSPIDTNYQKMPIYESVRELNAEIQYYSKFFLDGYNYEVRHLSSDKPKGTKTTDGTFEDIAIKEFSGKGFVVSRFLRNGKQYMLFVNKDYENPQTLTLNSEKKIKRLSYYKGERSRGKGLMSFDAQPGSIILLRL